MTHANELIEEAAVTPFIAHSGIEITEIKEGYAKGRILFEDYHKNLHGGMHGGCAFTLSDMVSGYALMAYGDIVTTINANVNYLLPIMNTKYVYCEANAVRRGKKVSVAETKITDDSGKVLMTGCFTFYNIGSRE